MTSPTGVFAFGKMIARHCRGASAVIEEEGEMPESGGAWSGEEWGHPKGPNSWFKPAPIIK